MNGKQQTAVQFLREMYHKLSPNEFGNLFGKAEEVEKAQIIEAYDEAQGKVIGEGKKYYEKTFRNN